MTQTETRSRRKEILEKRLSEKYESMTMNGTLCFAIKNGMICRIDTLGGQYDALVLEYAENLELAKKNIFGEDGDLYYMDTLDEEEMFKAMLSEIEAA